MLSPLSISLPQVTAYTAAPEFCTPPNTSYQATLSALTDGKSPNSKKPNLAPQVYAAPAPENKNGMEVSLALPAPAIKYVVLPGGGAPGAMIPFAISALSSEMLARIEQFSGCSCGALISAILAAGYNVKQLGENLEHTSLTGFLGSVPYFSALYPEVTTLPERSDTNFLRLMAQLGRMAIMSVFLSNWQRTGQAAIQSVDQWSTQGVSEHLNTTTIWQKCVAAHKAGTISDTQMQRLLVLQKGIWFTEPNETYASRMPYMITFADLALLHSIEPTIFKELHIVSSKIVDQMDENASGELKVIETHFNKKNSPNVPIAIAARASMSIPFYFETFWHKGNVYVDGSLNSRIPANAFWLSENQPDKVTAANRQAETMVLDFRTNGFWDTLHPILHQQRPPKVDTTLVSKTVEWFLGYPGYGSAVGQDNQNIYDAGPNTFVIDNGRIGPFDMRVSQSKFEIAKRGTISSMQQQLALRKNQAYYLSFDTVTAAWDALNETQKAAVRAAGDPRQDPDFDNQTADTQCVQTAFYALAMLSGETLGPISPISPLSPLSFPELVSPSVVTPPVKRASVTQQLYSYFVHENA